MNGKAASSRIPELDGVRGIAILMVVISHYIGASGYPPSGNILVKTIIPYLFSFGTGVTLFFVLSGYLIGGIILDNFQKPHFLTTFWMRRCCRILPILFLLIGFCFTLEAVLPPEGAAYHWLFDGLMPWWSYVLFVENIFMGKYGSFGGSFLAVTWSLAVEEQFYLIAPIAILLFGKKHFLRALLPLVLLSLLLTLIVALSSLPRLFVDLNLPFIMSGLLFGIGLAGLLRNEYLSRLLLESRGIILLCFSLQLVATAFLIQSRAFSFFYSIWWSLLYVVFICVALLYKGSHLTAVLRFTPLRFFGVISYGLYLLHQPVSGMIHGWLRNDQKPYFYDSWGAVVTGIAFLVAVMVSWVSFRFYETPFLRYGHRFNYEKGRSGK